MKAPPVSYARFISFYPEPSGFFTPSDSILRGRTEMRVRYREVAVSFESDQTVLLDRLDEAVRFASQPSHDLISKLIAGACTRIPVLTKSGKSAAMDRLVESGAWADVALALIELELPDWTVRRLIREDGQWHCSLSRHPNLPITLDDTADASHEIMPLAIFLAFLQTRRLTTPAAQSILVQSVPTVRSADASSAGLICCENFA
ncbi:MAG TPA: hypothetical protein VL048_07285 [Xanthobacteraceae bacterium]|nr:hypothetical protein [Xanthobacteraceae bacterium]